MSTGVAPTGGQVDMSVSGSASPGRTTPSACRVQPEGSSPRENTDTERVPVSSAAPTTTCTATEPVAGITKGAASINSSISEQPTSSPARIANSTNPAPGNTTTPDTAWSASQPCTPGDNLPVSNTPPDAGSLTTAPRRGWALVPSPRPA